MPALLGEPDDAPQLGADVVAQLGQLPALGRAVRRQEALAHAHGAERPRSRAALQPPGHADQLHRAAAEVEHAAVGERRRVDRRQVAVARLLLAAEHAHVEGEALARPLEELRCVLGVADRARRHGVDLRCGEAARVAEVREHVERRERAFDRLLPQATGGHEALPDPHRLIDLVGAPPPAFARLENDEPKRVRAEVDHRQPRPWRHRLERIARSGALYTAGSARFQRQARAERRPTCRLEAGTERQPTCAS